MATVNKDFKVKNGLQVVGSGSFGGTLTVAAPTESTHVATKAYVDSISGMAVSSTAPASPTNGQLWLDTTTNRVNFYYDGSWYTQATIDDTNNLAEHIHDTAIDGTGFIVSQFVNSGSFDSPLGVGLDAGGPTADGGALVFDGGSAVDNFN